MSYSDYLFLKNKYIHSTVNSNSSSHTQKKQITNIQNTFLYTHDNKYQNNVQRHLDSQVEIIMPNDPH